MIDLRYARSANNKCDGGIMHGIAPLVCVESVTMTKHDADYPHCHHEFRGGVCMKCGEHYLTSMTPRRYPKRGDK